MMTEQVQKDKIFSALSDANRRRIIEHLSQGESNLLELSKSFTISFQALSKHIKILQEAQIVNKRVEGKFRVLSLNRKALHSSLEWISYYSSFWEQSFDKLEALIQKEDGEKSSQ